MHEAKKCRAGKSQRRDPSAGPIITHEGPTAKITMKQENVGHERKWPTEHGHRKNTNIITETEIRKKPKITHAQHTLQVILNLTTEEFEEEDMTNG